MKKIQFKTGILAMVLWLMFGTSCQKNEQIVPNGQQLQKETTVAEELPLPEIEVLQMPLMQESTIDQELAIINEGIPSVEEMNINFDENTTTFSSKCPADKDFVRLLNALKLSREQKVKLHRAILAYKDCRTELYLKLKRVTQAIIEKGNVERKELITQYNRGKINKEQLQKSLTALNKRIKNAINESKDRKYIIAQLDKCWKTYIETLRLILTKDQWVLLMRWHKAIQ